MTRHSFNWFEESTRRKSLGEIIRKNGPRGVLLLVLTFFLAGAFVLAACEPGDGPYGERARVQAMAWDHRAPQWFPGGDRIVFNDSGAVYVIDFTGSQLIRVGGSTRTHQDTAFAPSVSPDGSRIAYAHYTDNWEIMTANPDGSDQRRLTHNDNDDVVPIWLSDGNSILFLSHVPYYWGISTVVVEGSDPPSAPMRVSDEYVAAAILKLSPDGNHLTFRGSMHDGLYYPVALYASEADGSGLTKLADGGESMSHPAWSPDSRRIAFARDEDNDRAGPPVKIYTISPDGTDLRKVIEFHRGDYPWSSSLAWSPDGSEIWFGSSVIAADGSTIRMLPGPSGFSAWSPDGSRVAFQTDKPWRIPSLSPPPRDDKYTVVIYTIARDGSDSRVLVERDSEGNIAAAGGKPLTEY